MKNLKIKLLVGLIGLTSIGLTHADTTTSNMEVSTTVTDSCTVTATNITFPSFSQTTASVEINSSATITPTCTKGTAYDISLNSGMNYNTERSMQHSTDSNEFLFYILGSYDQGKDLTPDIVAFSGVGDGYGGTVQNYTVDAVTYSNQRVISGNYSDTVTVTVTY